MSETRKPVFTEEDFKDMQQRFPTSGSDFAYGARFMMLHYIHLITTGKLRVVGTVKRMQVQETPHGFLDRCAPRVVPCFRRWTYGAPNAAKRSSHEPTI